MGDYSDLKPLGTSGTFAPGPHTLLGIVLTPDGTSAMVVEIQDSTDGTSGTLFRLRSTATASVVYPMTRGRRCANAIYAVFVSGTGGTASAEIA